MLESALLLPASYSSMSTASKLAPEALKLTVNLSEFIWPPTLSREHQPILGQKRAQTALAFGVAMPRPGYNIYVKGDSSTGRLSLIRQHLENHAKAQVTPSSSSVLEASSSRAFMSPSSSSWTGTSPREMACTC